MQRNLMIRILALTLMATMLLCAGCSHKSGPDAPAASDPEETTRPASENEDVQIETSYADLEIPYAFSDLVSVERVEGENFDSYVFSANLEDRSVEVYAINFVRGEDAMPGEYFGTLKTADGDVQVTFTAADPDESLQGEDLEAFYSAQETINDVFASIQATEGFTGT